MRCHCRDEQRLEAGGGPVDVVLGVAVTGPVARLALVGSDGHAVLDESVLDVSCGPAETLTSTIVGTHQSLSGTDHRLAATRVCWPDDGQAQTLRASLAG